MDNKTNGELSKTNGELAMKQLEDVSSEEIAERMKMLRHINVNGVGLYIDGSESWELMCELARLKANSIAVRHKSWLLTSSERQANTLPLVPRSRIPCTFIPTADGAFFGNLMLKNSFYVDNKDMCSASLVYSREGWLMFLSVPKRWGERETTLFLLNPFTDEMITLPPAPDIGCVRNHKAAFTVHNNRPDLVIFPCLNGRYIRILLTRPGDEKWEEHTTRVISRHVGLWDSLLCAGRIYCFFDHGDILMVFHLDGKYWSTYEDIDTGVYLLEFEGRILTVDPPLSHVFDGDKGFIVRELIICQDKASLVRLDDMELTNKSSFLVRNSHSALGLWGIKSIGLEWHHVLKQKRNGICIVCITMIC